MNIVVLYEKYSHVDKIMHIYKDNVKKDVESGLIGSRIETKNNYYFVSCVGCMHTINTIYALRKKIAIDALVRIGSCGVINEEILLESKLLIKNAINVDAISEKHLGSPKTSPSTKLFDLFSSNLDYQSVSAYTIDLIWQSADNSADVVDMETSALYAYADHIGVDAISISVARDNEFARITPEKQAELVMQISKNMIELFDDTE